MPHNHNALPESYAKTCTENSESEYEILIHDSLIIGPIAKIKRFVFDVQRLLILIKPQRKSLS